MLFENKIRSIKAAKDLIEEIKQFERNEIRELTYFFLAESKNIFHFLDIRSSQEGPAVLCDLFDQCNYRVQEEILNSIDWIFLSEIKALKKLNRSELIPTVLGSTLGKTNLKTVLACLHVSQYLNKGITKEKLIYVLDNDDFFDPRLITEAALTLSVYKEALSPHLWSTKILNKAKKNQDLIYACINALKHYPKDCLSLLRSTHDCKLDLSLLKRPLLQFCNKLIENSNSKELSEKYTAIETLPDWIRYFLLDLFHETIAYSHDIYLPEMYAHITWRNNTENKKYSKLNNIVDVISVESKYFDLEIFPGFTEYLEFDKLFGIRIITVKFEHEYQDAGSLFTKNVSEIYRQIKIAEPANPILDEFILLQKKYSNNPPPILLTISPDLLSTNQRANSIDVGIFNSFDYSVILNQKLPEVSLSSEELSKFKGQEDPFLKFYILLKGKSKGFHISNNQITVITSDRSANAIKNLLDDHLMLHLKDKDLIDYKCKFEFIIKEVTNQASVLNELIRSDYILAIGTGPILAKILDIENDHAPIILFTYSDLVKTLKESPRNVNAMITKNNGNFIDFLSKIILYQALNYNISEEQYKLGQNKKFVYRLAKLVYLVNATLSNDKFSFVDYICKNLDKFYTDSKSGAFYAGPQKRISISRAVDKSYNFDKGEFKLPLSLISPQIYQDVFNKRTQILKDIINQIDNLEKIAQTKIDIQNFTYLKTLYSLAKNDDEYCVTDMDPEEILDFFNDEFDKIYSLTPQKYHVTK
jgi:hypothetical protein